MGEGGERRRMSGESGQTAQDSEIRRGKPLGIVRPLRRGFFPELNPAFSPSYPARVCLR